MARTSGRDDSHEIMPDNEPGAERPMEVLPAERMPSPLSTIEPPGESRLATMSDEEFEVALVGAKRERQRIIKVQREVMKEGVDYGKIPGTKNPTLLKPGAEVLCRMMRRRPRFIPNISYGGENQPPINVVVHCQLLDELGSVVSEGVGSCNSWEKKYRYRQAAATCPECGKANLRKSKKDPEWYCWRKTDGCGATFKLNDKRITGQETGQVENPDPWESQNTIVKIAHKRAFVDAVLKDACASGTFTQDLEEQTPEEYSEMGGGEFDQPRETKPSPKEAPAVLISENDVVHLRNLLKALGVKTQGQAKQVLSDYLPAEQTMEPDSGNLDLHRIRAENVARLVKALEERATKQKADDEAFEKRDEAEKEKASTAEEEL